MISINQIGNVSNDRILELNGLSTDEKPVGEVNGEKIVNGSTYFEMDTCNLFMYDAENQRWIEL
jgi:hypothetical protein